MLDFMHAIILIFVIVLIVEMLADNYHNIPFTLA